MAGLRKIAKMYGGIKVADRRGRTTDYVWDYANDEPVKKEDMPEGSARWAASEQARHIAQNRFSD